MQFSTWLRQQTHRDDPVGDVARDYVRDICAPRGVARLVEYIDRVGYQGSRRALQRAVAEWRAWDHTMPSTFIGASPYRKNSERSKFEDAK